MTKEPMDVSEHFSKERSKTYDNRIETVIPGYAVMHEMALYLLKNALPESSKLLICGAGTGQEAIIYARENPGWKITGFDPSASMLAIAEEKIQTAALVERITLINTRLSEITDRGFDAATSILVMHFLPDDGQKQEWLKGISKKLKPGAKLILVDLEGDKSSKNFKRLLDAWKAHQYRTTTDAAEVRSNFERIETDVNIVAQSRLEVLMELAGFTDIQKFYQAYVFGGYIATKG